ncbi:MAG: hypothetical protein J6K85_01670 [Clostridia bacterium]|nr:hypothetical protein [Clostridia bacterium]
MNNEKQSLDEKENKNQSERESNIELFQKALVEGISSQFENILKAYPPNDKSI